MMANITILNDAQSSELRKKYIQSFVDSRSEYYAEHILAMKQCRDGMCYDGYLWDCLAAPTVVSETEAHRALHEKENFYILWDIHSCEKIWIPHYWKYPKASVLRAEKWTDALRKELPEDIYLFDDSFQWSVIFTHETDESEESYCLLCRK